MMSQEEFNAWLAEIELTTNTTNLDAMRKKIDQLYEERSTYHQYIALMVATNRQMSKLVMQRDLDIVVGNWVRE